MNPLDTLEKAIAWADNRAKSFSKSNIKAYYVVCKWNEGFIVHHINEVLNHLKEYSCDELVYCTDAEELKKLIIMIRFALNSKK